jgi:hypothetical protein
MFIRCFLACAAGIAAAGSAQAALVGSAAFTPTAGVGQTQYQGVVSNTGTTTIGTFWFGWIPGQNYMGSAPLTVTTPAGWTSLVTHGSATDGWGIRWTANSAASYIQTGQSLSGFNFTSAVTPAGLLGNSPFYANVPTTTSFFYIGAPFADPGLQIVASVVPSPMSACVLAGLMVPAMRRRR